MTANQPILPKLYTYQDIAEMFRVHWKTVSRWFASRKILRLNHSTVRITQDQLDKFIRESGRQPKKEK